MGESHTGKTRSLSTLPGKSVLFNFDSPDNVSALRVPYKEVARLEDYWPDPFDFGKVLVVNYTAMPREVSLLANPPLRKDLVEILLKDINSVYQHLDVLATDEGNGTLIIETLGPFGDAVLDYIVASAGRADTQIQDYRPAMRKIAAVFGSMMGTGMNVIVTGHLQSEKDEITGRGRITPLIWGKILPEAIPKMFGEVFQSVVVSDGKGGVQYKWLTKPEPNGFIGFLGTRKFDNLPKYIDQDYGYLDRESKMLETKKK